MKAFRFSLDRVLKWRQSQLTVEESKLERLRSDLQAIHHQIEQVAQSRSNIESATLQSASLRGADLRNLDHFRQWANSETRRLTTAIRGAEAAIAAQQSAVTEARRRVRLLERMKERRRATWHADQERELAELAGESAIAQWRRAN